MVTLEETNPRGLMATVDDIKAYARGLRKHFKDSCPDTDLLTFGIATEYLREVVGNEWTNQMVFGEHPTVSREYRIGRSFMKVNEENEEDRYRNQQRTLRAAELLFNLRSVSKIETLLNDLRAGRLESTYSELEAGQFLFVRGIKFQYVPPRGLKGFDYDAELVLTDGSKLNCEMKCKVEDTPLSASALLNSLQDARKQLPSGQPAIVFVKIPELWVRQPTVWQVVPRTIDTFLRKTTRVVAVVIKWEELHLLARGGSVFPYKYRLERGIKPQSLTTPVNEVLIKVDGPPTVAWVSFRSIADEVVGT